MSIEPAMSLDPEVRTVEDTDATFAEVPRATDVEVPDLASLFTDVHELHDELERPEVRVIYDFAPESAFDDVFEEVPVTHDGPHGEEEPRP